MMQRMRLITGLIVLGFAMAALPAEPQSAWSWAISVQEDRELQLVHYCSEKLPASKASLESDYLQYKMRVQEAASSLRARGVAGPYLSRPPSPSAVADTQRALAVMLEVAGIRDANRFCQELSTRLTLKLPEAIEADIQRTLASESAFRDPKVTSVISHRRLTTACSDLDHHKVHAPDCHRSIWVSDRAPHEWRPVADSGRWASLPLCLAE